MAQYSVYLKGELEKEILAMAKELHMPPSQVVILRLEQERISRRLGRVENKLDALLHVFEVILPDVAYAAGATKGASAKHPEATREGGRLRESAERALNGLKVLWEPFSFKR